MDTIKNLLKIICLVAAVIAADQALKSYCRSVFIDNESAPLIAGNDAVHLTRVMNPGLIFHKFSGLPRGEKELYIRYLPTAALALFLLIFLGTRGLGSSGAERAGFAFLIAGATSNLWDHWNSYFVMDTLKVLVGPRYRYQAFNLADAAITVGLLLLFTAQGKELLGTLLGTPMGRSVYRKH